MDKEDENRKVWLTKWWVWLIICIVFLAAVQISFSITAPNKWLRAVWAAGDLITFVGTITLGYVALRQSKMANDMAEQANMVSKALMEIEQNRYKLELRPFFMVADWKAHLMDLVDIRFAPDKLYIQVGHCEEGKAVLCLSFLAINTTQSCISVEYSTAHCQNGTNWLHATTNQHNEKITLRQGEEAEITFYAKPEFFKQHIAEVINMEFVLENRFTERYLQTFDLMIMVLTDKCAHPTNQWFCSLTTQKYKVSQYVKNKEGKYELAPEEDNKDNRTYHST